LLVEQADLDHSCRLPERGLKAMSLKKVAKMTAWSLGAAALVIGTGLILSQTPGSDSSERKARLPSSAPRETVPGSVQAVEVADAYRTNEALADEKFTGKRTIVTGKMLQIKRVGVNLKDGDIRYDLLMSTGEPRDGFLNFAFGGTKHREHLAKLKVGQWVTIAGTPEGHKTKHEDGQEVVYFWGCEVIKSGD